jgi:hypothetical protein
VDGNPSLWRISSPFHDGRPCGFPTDPNAPTTIASATCGRSLRSRSRTPPVFGGGFRYFTTTMLAATFFNTSVDTSPDSSARLPSFLSTTMTGVDLSAGS